MKNLIVANWKMNPASQKEGKEIFEAIRDGVKGLKEEVVICPPSVYLYASVFGQGIVSMGAQNVYFEDKGAFTGEISCTMLKDLGAEYVIIGHSERRKYFGETDEIINKKIKKALEAGLKVIFCIGETAEERDAGKKNEVLERQIKIGLDGILNLENLNIAYEPVWAIGTGNNCGVVEAKEAISFIKNLVGAVDRSTGPRVLYGGSVKSENSGAYIKEAGANGLLVGGASLNAEEFVKIVKSAE
ncbi:MAG: triose-phosphate isomerase [Candidatus Staskawiczbacteria bacterium]|nr:triose-phosphate isomerase [Candidatus Staskawiczbacteria bacterium]